MKKIKCYLWYAASMIAIAGCTKSNGEKTPTLSAAELLTAKPWKLLSYGFDSNQNGFIDANEDGIMDCETDNTYIFNKDGSGVVNENSKICNGSDPSHPFIWALRNNDTVLDFYFGIANVVKLTSDSLYISGPGQDPVKLILIYVH